MVELVLTENPRQIIDRNDIFRLKLKGAFVVRHGFKLLSGHVVQHRHSENRFGAVGFAAQNERQYLSGGADR